MLREHGQSLQSEGVNSTGLRPEIAMTAIAVLKAAQVGILGGEVWAETGQRFELRTAYIWDIERSAFEDEKKFLDASWKLAESQVARHMSSRGVFVSLVI